MIKISLNGVMSRPLNTDTMNYVNNLLSNYEPMIVVSMKIILLLIFDKNNIISALFFKLFTYK